MDWIQLIGAVGIGAVVTKFLDIFWLQRLAQRHERESWLRGQRLNVYGDLTEELLTEGAWRGNLRESEAKKLAARAILLTDDDHLASLINKFFPETFEAQARLNQFINNGTSTIEERTAMREKEEKLMRKRAQDIVQKLRKALVS